MSGPSDADGGIIGGAEDLKKAEKMAARQARFNNELEGNRYKELEGARAVERAAYFSKGGDKKAMRGTCEGMCAPYEIEFREYTSDISPLEARADAKNRIDHAKAVAAYTRSDAGAGHGEAAKLPSDLRSPQALVRTADYLFTEILPTPPPGSKHATARMALEHTAGFIRDRTRAIRKEFAMQSTWGHEEAIATFERIARWHILCLRELQEETGKSKDLHIDSAELGRCFTSLRQQYNDRREELGVDLPCPNEPEFRAYMLIFDLTQRGTATACAEVPAAILDHPNVKLAWKIRRTAQRNFDSQKEGSKQNAEFGSNLITAYTRLLKSSQVPYLLSCLAEVRLREMRRSALRALQQTYTRPRGDLVRRGDNGEVQSMQMIPIELLAKLLGCEEQETEPSGSEDVEYIERDPAVEAADIARRFGLEVHSQDGRPLGVILHKGVPFDDNKDAPFTRRWQIITDRQGQAEYGDIIDGRAGIMTDPNAPVIIPKSRASFVKPKLTPAPQSKAPSAFGNFGTTPISQRGFGGFVPTGQTRPTPTNGGLGLSFKSPSVEPAPNNAPAQSAQSKSAFGGIGGGVKSAFDPGAGSSLIVPVTNPFGKTSEKPAQAELPNAKSMFKIPAIPEKRPTTEVEPTGKSVPSFAFGTKVDTSAAFPASTPSFSFNTSPTTGTSDAAAPAPAASSDIQNILSKPSFFGGTKSSQAIQLPTIAPSSQTAFAGPVTPSAATAPTSPSAAPAQESSTSTFSFAVRAADPTAQPTEVPAAPTTDDHRKVSLRASSASGQLRESLTRSAGPSRSRAAILRIPLRPSDVAQAVATLSHEMTADAIRKMLTEISPELGEYVDELATAMHHRKLQAWRRQLLEQCRDAVFDEIFHDHIEALCTELVEAEIEEREAEEQSERDMENLKMVKAEEAERLAESIRDLGFGGQAIVLTPKAPQMSTFSLPSGSELGSPQFSGRETIGSENEIARDFALHQAHQMTERFYEPATFLRTIGKHAERLTSACDGIEATFNVVLSRSSDPGAATPEQAREWLVQKLSAPDGDEQLYCNQILDLACQAVGRFDEIDLDNVGIYVFEAPVAMDGSSDQIVSDAQDRMNALIDDIRVNRNKTPYPAVLLLTTWSDETLESVAQRLDIESEVAYFDKYGVVSLQDATHLDQHFDKAIAELLGELEAKVQLRIPFDRLLLDITPQWLRLLSMAHTSLRDHPSDVKLAGTCLSRGLEALNFAHQGIDRACEGKRHEANSTYDPVILPKLDEQALDTSSRSTFVTSLEEYFSADTFAGLNDIHLGLACLRDAVHGSQALPLQQLLSALGGLVLGELRDQTICLQYYDTPDAIRKKASDFRQQAVGAFRTCVDIMITKIGTTATAAQYAADGKAASERDILQARYILSPTPTHSASDYSRLEPNGALSKKRHVSMDQTNDCSPARARGSKKARNDRLLQAIRAAQGTIGSGGDEENESVDDVDDFASSVSSVYA